ncbi:MAG: hypothetical protein JW699_04085 [Chitinispirillaceae bacterium]|nr:hypothetical protein [Chitinispirillaceae bacterium]
MGAHTSVPGTGGRRPGWSRRTGVYAALFAVTAAAVFSGFLFSDTMLFTSDQLSGLDGKVFMRTALGTHGQFPFWFNARLGGMPTIDALFGDALYPPSLIINAVFPVHRAIGMKIILHVFLAGLFFFLLLRRGFNCSAPVAFIGGALYMLNPEFFSHIYPGHDGKMYVIALMPFMVWRLKALADAPSLFNATILGLGIGLSLLTSHVQLTYFILWGLFSYAVFAVIVLLRQSRKGTAVRLGLFFALSVAIGLAIGFIQLFPALMYVKEAFSVRGVDRGFEYAASWSLHWPELFSLWIPEFGNTLDYYWGGNAFKLNSEYAGGMALLLAVIALVWKPRPWRFFWLGVALFAVLYALGAHTPVFYAAYYLIPGVKKFRACSMIMCWFSFSVVLLAALFLKNTLNGELSLFSERNRKRWTKGLLSAMAGIVLVALLFSIKDAVAGMMPFVAELDSQKLKIFEANFSRNFVPALWLWVFFAEITLGMTIAVMHGRVKPAVIAGVVLMFGLIDVLRVDAQFNKTISPRPYFYSDPALEKLEREMSSSPFRVFALPGALKQNGEGVHGLEGVGGFHDNELRWYREFRGDRDDRNYFDKILAFSSDGRPYLDAEKIDKGNAFLDIANVKYLLVRNDRGIVAVENRNAFGRVSFAPNHTVIDSLRIIESLRRGAFNYRTTVALSEPPSLKPAESIPDSAATRLPPFSAEWLRYTPNIRVVKVTAAQEGFLRIAEVYYPGWKVLIDGKPAQVYRADGAWMAVYLPRGTHKAEIIARSPYFGTAALVTFPVLLLLSLYWGARMFLFKKHQLPRGGVPV